MDQPARIHREAAHRLQRRRGLLRPHLDGYAAPRIDRLLPRDILQRDAAIVPHRPGVVTGRVATVLLRRTGRLVGRAGEPVEDRHLRDRPGARVFGAGGRVADFVSVA